MSLTLRTATPSNRPELAPFIDACFERAGRESRLVEILESGDPAFDAGLAILAENDGEPAGWALFLPRSLRLRGADVRLAISLPFAVLPDQREQGVGRFLMEAGSQALRDRSIRGAMAIGHPGFFGRFDYASSFGLHTVVARREDLPDGKEKPGTADGWRGLSGSDLPHVARLQRQNYAAIDGSECRSEAPLDWESAEPSGHSLVLESGGEVLAYLRFRVRGELEVRECAVLDQRGVDGVLRFLGRLLREHSRAQIEVHVPPPHPVSRALFRRGGQCRRTSFGNGVLLRVLDWPGILRDTAPSWSSALEASGHGACSFEVDGASLRLEAKPQGLEVTSGTEPGAHIKVPHGWGPPLLTGMRDHRDLTFEGAAADVDPKLLSALFPGGTPMWTYGPVFEVADD